MPIRPTGPAPTFRAADVRFYRAALAVSDQILLQVDELCAGLVPMVPGPSAVRAEPPGRYARIHREIDQVAQLRLVPRVRHADQHLNAPIQVPVHQIRAADPDFVVVASAARAERVDPGVLK